MKTKEKADVGAEQLKAFQDVAQSFGQTQAVELATESLVHIEERALDFAEILKAMDVADRNLFKKFPGLEVAVAARLLRGSNITGEPEIAWIRSLPETWPFSWSLTEAQKHVLQGTKAQRPIATNDLVLSQLEDMEVQGRHLSHSDAKWILGFFLHHGLEGQFMPGLLDGLVRHFDLSRCAGLAKNVAATGRLPGWALLAQKVMKAGEQVFLCTEQPNGQLFAMYGVVYPDNPTGVALTQATIQDSMLDSLLQQAQLTCDHSEVRSLFLRRSEELLTPRNLRCSSVLWLGGGEISRRALSFGYLDTWPRPVVASVGELEVKTWRLAELKLYQLLMKECNASKDGLHTVDIDILEGVKHENSRLSKSVLLVRDQELRLFEHCERKKQEELKEMLKAEEGGDFIDADPEKIVKCIKLAQESGWQALSRRATEIQSKRMQQAIKLAEAASDDEAIHGFRFVVRTWTEASRLNLSAASELHDTMAKVMLEGPPLQLFRAYAWCTDAGAPYEQVAEKLKHVMESWAKGPENAPKDVDRLYKSALELLKVNTALADFVKATELLMAADKKMKSVIKDAEENPTDVLKVLEAIEVVGQRSPTHPFNKKVEKMISRAFEESKQSGDKKQLELLKEKASKEIREAAAEVLKAVDGLAQCLAHGDWAGVCALAADFQSKGCHAFAKDARQQLRDRIDELQTLKAESAALVVYELFTAAKQNGIDELAELLIEKLGASLPDGWATMKADSTSVRKELVTDQQVLDTIQEMVTHTFKTWGGVAKTRDRKGGVMAKALKADKL
eukprot:symbB.v1.2.030522.t2/scaffold3438.1/size56642/2